MLDPLLTLYRVLNCFSHDRLFRGNLVLECPVPSALLDLCPLNHRTEQEFSLMRYTAVTCQPDDFEVSIGSPHCYCFPYQRSGRQVLNL